MLARLLPVAMRTDILVLVSFGCALRESLAAGNLASELMHWRAALSEWMGPEPSRLVARALSLTLREHAVEPKWLESELEGIARLRLVGSFETRGALFAQADQCCLGMRLGLLEILGIRSERTEALAACLAPAVQLTDWLENFEQAFQNGFLPLAADDLARHDISILDLGRPEAPRALGALMIEHIAWIRELLERGWPLCAELGPVRGRLLAFLLRQQAARLVCMERGAERAAAPKRGGWLRIAACLAASLASTRAPALRSPSTRC